MAIYDSIVIGAGTMGSAVAYHLARRGQHVLILEQFNAVHDLGSHTGYTRIIRHAYFESPEYVPLVMRSDELWQQLEKDSSRKMLVRTGGIDMGPEHGVLFSGALRACLQHKLPHEHLRSHEASKRWPQFQIPEDWHICFDPMAGFLIVEICIRSHLQLAQQNGAELRENETVESIQFGNNSVQVRTSKSSYHTGSIIVSGGAWNARLLAELSLPLKVQRQAIGWFLPQTPSAFQPSRFPAFLAETPQGIFYGLPLHDHAGLKLARHGGGLYFNDPAEVPREFGQQDLIQLQNYLKEYLRDVSPELLEGKVCLYTMTPDEHFIIDVHPEFPRCFIAAGFSGHGFKFAPVVGEIMAELCMDGRTQHPIEGFQIKRFNSL